MAKIQSWDQSKWKSELAKRLKQARKYRERFESQWRINETTVYNWHSRNEFDVTLTEDNLVSVNSPDAGSPVTEMAVNYAWKFLRFIHSQMSANPPSVIARPTSTDLEDRIKADGADRIVRHAIQDKDMQEIADQTNLKCLTYGTGWISVRWDPDLGEALEVEKDDVTMEGDIRVSSPSTWDIWISPNGKCWRDVPWLFERVEMSTDEAMFKWEKSKEDIERFVKKKPIEESELDDWRDREDIVEVFLYTEKGLAINGMVGRQAWCLEDGTLLGDPGENPNPNRVLGYAIITDVDVPDIVYGKSFIEYVYKLQDLLNRLDTSFVENIAAHNVVRMVLPENAEIEDDALSNSAWDYVTITNMGNSPPHFVPPAQLMPDCHKLRENLIQAIQELAGVNDSMLGQVKREMSGFSIQTAIDAGNQTRRRLFNKYTAMVRDTFKMYLSNAVKYWEEPRTIMVLGKEKAFEAADLAGSDIDGGFDVICEYGASLSLDPARRREEIMQLVPILKEAGVPMKTVVGYLRLNELDSLYDRPQQSADRQREIFEEIIATGKDIAPRELEDDVGMLDYAYYYVMTASYKYLDDETKERIDSHIKQREVNAKEKAMKGQQPAPGAPPVEGQPAPLPTEGAVPAGAPMPAPVAPAA